MLPELKLQVKRVPASYASTKRRVGPGGRHRRMPVHDGTLGDREDREGATATGGGGRGRVGGDAVVGGVGSF